MSCLVHSNYSILIALFSTQEQARLISIAWKCAHDTYNPPPCSSLLSHDFQDCTLTQEQIITPSSDGTVKTVTFTSVTPRETSMSTSLPVLIVAIRGTASRVDHMVNINNQPRDASSFIVSCPGKFYHRFMTNL